MKHMLKYFFLLFVLSTGFLAAQESFPKDIDTLDEKIAYLQKKKAGLEKKASYAERESDRLVFVDYFSSAHLASQAENFRKEAEAIEKQIRTLENRKRLLE